MAVGAVLEQEEVGLGRVARLLVQQQPRRLPGVGAQSAEAREAREARRAAPRRAPGRHRRCARRPRRASARARRRHGETSPSPTPSRVPTCSGSSASSIMRRLDRGGARPPRPASASRPRPWARSSGTPASRPRDRVAGAQRRLEPLGPRGGVHDRPHRRGGRDLVHGADHGEHRAVYVGQRHRAIADHEAALEHAVVGHELAQEVRRKGPAKRPHPSPSGSAAGALGAARAPRGRAAGARSRPAGAATLPDRAAGTRCGSSAGTAVRPNTVASTPAPASAISSGIPSGSAPRASTGLRVIRRVDALTAEVGGGLVAEHAALRVAGDVDVGARRPAAPAHGFGDRHDMVCEVSLRPPSSCSGAREVDHPRVGAVLVQDETALDEGETS